MQLHYLDEAASDFVRRGVETVQDIHRDGTPGDILLLLPGTLQKRHLLPHTLDISEPPANLSLTPGVHVPT